MKLNFLYFLLSAIYTLDSDGCIVFFIHPSVAMGYGNNTTFDASMWNGSVGVLSTCVINNIPLDHVL